MESYIIVESLIFADYLFFMQIKILKLQVSDALENKSSQLLNARDVVNEIYSNNRKLFHQAKILDYPFEIDYLIKMSFAVLYFYCDIKLFVFFCLVFFQQRTKKDSCSFTFFVIHTIQQIRTRRQMREEEEEDLRIE